MIKEKMHTCNPSGWIEAYSDEFLRFTISRISNREEAEDIVQETFLSALKALENFRRDSSEKTWLYNILKNKIVDYYRKSSRQNNSGKTSVEGDPEFYDHFFSNAGKMKGAWNESSLPKPWGLEADEALHEEEFMQILRFCMEKLPQLWSAVFSLRNMDDKSTDEICKELEISSSNLWVIIHRAKLQLRECMEKNWIKN